MKIFIPYKSLEEKAAIIALNQDKTFTREAMVGKRQFLVFDDNQDIPFEIPDPTVKSLAVVLVGKMNETRAALNTLLAAPDQLPLLVLGDIKDEVEAGL